MPFETQKTRVRELQKSVDLSFYKPQRVLGKYGYTQKRLADELNLSQTTLNSIINGNPNIAQIKLLADAIGCDFTEFFDFDRWGTIHDSITGRAECPACKTTLIVTLSCPENSPS